MMLFPIENLYFYRLKISNPLVHQWKWSHLEKWKDSSPLRALIVYSQVNLATVVKGDQKVPFWIATTPRCRGGRETFPWIALLYPWYVPYIARRYQIPFLKSLVWLNLRLNPGLLDHWRTLYPLGQWAGLIVYKRGKKMIIDNLPLT